MGDRNVSGSVAITQRSLHHDHIRRIRRLRKPEVPVINVNPFMSERQHTWSKEKSLPEFYEKPDVVHNSTEAFVKPPPTAFSTSSDSMLTTRENRPILPLSQLNKPNLEAANVSSCPPKTSPGKIRLYDEPPYVDTVRGRKIVFPPTPRDQCISPENPIKRLPKHGFAPTIVDREKKTVVESPVTKPTSLLNRERTQEFITKQQVLKLRGLRMMDGGHLAPAPSTYLRTGAMPMKSLEDFYRQLVNSYNRGYAFSPAKARHSYITPSQMYGAHDKEGDPLLSLNHESMSNRLYSSVDTTEAKSAFRLLETAGKPTYIEQNLERDYTMFYDTTKHGTTAAAGHHFTRFLKLKNYNPTQGELFIMVNKEQNRPGNYSRHQHQPLTASSQSAKPKTETWGLSSNELTLAERSGSVARDDALSAEDKENLEANEQEQTTADHEANSIAGSAGKESKTPDRLEITTTLPDINSTSG